MKVKLISMTPNPIDVMWTAARTCYSSKGPIEMWDDINKDDNKFNVLSMDKRWKLVKTVLDSGHQSIAEHVYFTFAIEGISRACSHQLVRHRAGIVFSQQSQRYVEIKEDINEVQNFRAFSASERENAIKMCSKYFVDVNESNYRGYIEALWEYLNAINNGLKPEDARNFLPNATKTNITMSVNFRELIHICNLRLCTRAQDEIRTLFGIIRLAVYRENDKLASLLVPSCERDGFCNEHKSCDRKPKLENIIEGYEKYKDLNK